MLRTFLRVLVYFSIICCCLFLINISNAQAKQSDLPDSLKSRFYAEKDVEKRFDQVLEAASQELSATVSNAISAYGVFLADSLQDRKKLAKAYEDYGVSFHKKGDYISGIENLGQALQLFELLNSPEDVAKIK
ncbi:MAG: hypothetical protein ACXIUD_02270 [Mongoliitalea sp.]